MSKNNTIQILNNQELTTFTSQMGMMISAGITIDEALRLLEQDTESLEGKVVIHDIYDVLETGKSLYISMKESGHFPKYVLDMVNIGEQTGKLDTVFASLAEYYEREEAIADGIKQAITYPFVMIIMMLCVIIVLISKVMPVFQQVYEQLGTTMTGISASILKLGGTFSRFSIIFILIFCAVVLAYIIFTKTEKGKAVFYKFVTHFPLTRTLYDKIAASRFSSALSIAMSSGFTTIESIIMVEQLITNNLYKKKITLCKTLMEEGSEFSEAAVKSNIFSGSYGRMVSVGYKSGRLDSVMEKVSQRYEYEIDREVNNFVSVLEPTLVAILSVIVGMILLSVMLPLLGIMSQIG